METAPHLAVVTFFTTSGKLSVRTFTGKNAWPNAKEWSEKLGHRLVDCDLREVMVIETLQQPKLSRPKA